MDESRLKLPDEDIQHLTIQLRDGEEVSFWDDSGAARHAVEAAIEFMSEFELEPDRFKLDEELSAQPRMMSDASYIVSVCRVWHQTLDNLYRTLESEITLMHRLNHENRGEKYSEAKLASITATHWSIPMAREERTYWTGLVSRSEGIREAVVQRSLALSKLVSLWENEYYMTDSKVSKKLSKSK